MPEQIIEEVWIKFGNKIEGRMSPKTITLKSETEGVLKDGRPVTKTKRGWTYTILGVSFIYVKKTPQEPTRCPKYNHKFTPMNEEEVRIFYKVVASIASAKQSRPSTEKTYIEVSSVPTDAFDTFKIYPHNLDELISTMKKLLAEYRAEGWIHGLGSDAPRKVFVDDIHQGDMVDKQVAEAVAWIEKFDYKPKFEQEKE